MGLPIKILTGDNDKVTQAVCEKVGLDVERILLGSEIDTMTDQELAQVVETTTVFAKLSPDQKRGSSSVSRTMATRWVTWEMGLTMLHP